MLWPGAPTPSGLSDLALAHLFLIFHISSEEYLPGYLVFCLAFPFGRRSYANLDHLLVMSTPPEGMQVRYGQGRAARVTSEQRSERGVQS